MLWLEPLMPVGRRPAKEPAPPRLSACKNEAPDELDWKAPDEELDHVLVSVDGEKEVDPGGLEPPASCVPRRRSPS